jgi:hypothetical protein
VLKPSAGSPTFGARFAKLSDDQNQIDYLFTVLEGLLERVSPTAASSYLSHIREQLGHTRLLKLVDNATSDELANLVISFEAACEFQPCRKDIDESRQELKLEMSFLKQLLALAMHRSIRVLIKSASRIPGARRARLVGCYLATAEEHEAAGQFLKRLTDLRSKEENDSEDEAALVVVTLLITFAVSEAQRCDEFRMPSIAFMLIYRLLAFSHRDLLEHVMGLYKVSSRELRRIIKQNTAFWAWRGYFKLRIGEEVKGADS